MTEPLFSEKTTKAITRAFVIVALVLCLAIVVGIVGMTVALMLSAFGGLA